MQMQITNCLCPLFVVLFYCRILCICTINVIVFYLICRRNVFAQKDCIRSLPLYRVDVSALCAHAVRSRVFSLTKLIISMSIDDLSSDVQAMPHAFIAINLYEILFALAIDLFMHACNEKNAWMLTWVCSNARFLRAYPKNQQTISQTLTHPIQIDRCNVIDKRSNRNGFFMLHSAAHSLRPILRMCVWFHLLFICLLCFALPVCLFVCQSVSVWLMFLFLAISPGCLLCIVVVMLDTWIRLCLCKN